MAKKICKYALLCALCLICGYIESLFSLSFIAPGIKLGLSNCIALLLVSSGDIKGAFAVNITRILLSTLLFSSPFSLVFSLPAGIVSLFAVCFAYKLKFFGTIGLSVIGGTVHNLVQAISAYLLLGSGVLYYLPFLLISGLVSGSIIGIIAGLTLPKINKFLN